MTNPAEGINPERITKPMQLLAAWLIGLIIVDGSFLTAAAKMEAGSWERGALVLAAIVNVPLFLFALFLLQTRFRPELQEDSYYSRYLDKRTNEVITIGREEFLEKEISSIRSDLRLLTDQATVSTPSSTARVAGTRQLRIGLNHHFGDLRNALRTAGIALDEVFGTDAIPEHRAMAIAEYLAFDDKLRMLHLAVDMHLDAYTYFDPREEDTTQDVLVGSYGPPDFAITPDLTAVLDADPEPADLRLYEAQHVFRSDTGA